MCKIIIDLSIVIVLYMDNTNDYCYGLLDQSNAFLANYIKQNLMTSTNFVHIECTCFSILKSNQVTDALKAHVTNQLGMRN